jgi:hypothetical protein
VDKSTHVTLGGFLVGLAVGFGGGVLFQIARAAWKTLAVIKDGVSSASSAARKRTFEFLILGFFLAVVAALALGQLGEH